MSRANRAYASTMRSGKLATYKRVTLVEDDLTGEITETIETQQLATVVLPDAETMSNGVVAGSGVAEKARKVIAAAKGATFAPKSGDTLEWGGEDWTVVGCSPLNPNAAEDIIFQIGVTR